MIIKNLKRIIRLVFFLVIFAALAVAGVIVGINMYRDLKGNEAKKYLVEKYGFEEKELFVKAFKEYVNKDVANCDTLWLKECTDDENMVASVTFKVKTNDKEIEVVAYKDETFSDDYDALPTKAWQEQKQREEEIKKQQEEQQRQEREKIPVAK